MINYIFFFLPGFLVGFLFTSLTPSQPAALETSTGIPRCTCTYHMWPQRGSLTSSAMIGSKHERLLRRGPRGERRNERNQRGGGGKERAADKMRGSRRREMKRKRGSGTEGGREGGKKGV